MLTISCPSCKRVLNLPDHAVGRPVRCPGCAYVFDSGGQIQPWTSSPVLAPSQPEPVADDLPRPPWSRANGLSSIALDEEDAGFFDDDRVRAKANGVVALLFLALGVDALIGLLFGYQTFLAANPPGARVAGFLCFIVFFLPPVSFIVVGTSFLLNRRGWGMVMTAGIMSILVGVFLLLVVYFVATTRFNRAFGGQVSELFYLEVSLYLAGAVTNIGVGIRTLVAINHEDLKSAFR